MITNDRGNTLITVLLASLVFTVLGMAIVASTIGGAKKTETRESDVSITYDSIKLVDKMTSDLALLLNTFPLDNYRTKDFTNKLEVLSSFDSELHDELFKKLIEPNQDNSTLSCINIIDLSNDVPFYIDGAAECTGSLTDYDHFEIEKDKDFTRVFDIVLVTKNPSEIEGKITRTITKRLILSPLPSFLKYTAGSDDKFILNGSANFNGNIYAGSLEIDEKAKYNLRDNSVKEIASPLSSINGDIFSQSAELLPILIKDNFYKEKIPELKHDSQFVNIDFEKTMNESINDVLAFSSLPTKRSNGGTFYDELKNDIGQLSSPSGYFNNCIKEEEEDNEEEEPDQEGSTKSAASTNSIYSSDESCILSDEETFYGPESLGIGGNLVITSTVYPIILNDLAVDGDLFIGGNSDITIDGDLIVEGDLYLVGNQSVSIKGNVYVSGKTHLLNFGGKLELEKNLISADTITAEAHVTNKNNYENSGLKFKGDIISGKDLVIKPVNSTIEVSKNIFTNHTFTISGDEVDGSMENDEVIFDSVVYAGKNAYISNANILGANNNEKQLILMAKGDLLITRINEFNNFESLNEGEIPYLPINDRKIKPLKGFFYTENNAELYGVGSLFYIKGGIFARKELTVNSIRGEVTNINNLPSRISQKDSFSRFIVDYDQDVMLKQIDALPIVEHLQIFSDELLIK